MNKKAEITDEQIEYCKCIYEKYATVDWKNAIFIFLEDIILEEVLDDKD